MTTKTTGAEFKRFYADEIYWPKDDGNTWHEEETVLVNGEVHENDYETIPDDALVTIEGGIVFGPKWDENEPSFELYFKRWRKQQTTTTLVVEIDRSKEEYLRMAIKAGGGKVTN
jgi:hypothetical protein